VWLDYPSLLGLPGARLRAYQAETTIAEKFHAMVVLGQANSRMKDFFDIAALAMHEHFNGEKLAAAIKATFHRRGTEFPKETPIALTPEFANDAVKQQQWAGFIAGSRLSNVLTLEFAVTSAHGLIAPILEAFLKGSEFHRSWSPGGPWK
ncbi:MAG: nucleotidyl transferase AbiEii/AbiGii toxin family protein, partial [Gammaproteobacteria bacterium]